jgi:hypothetical protein
MDTNFILKNGKGKSTNLDKAYNNLINEVRWGCENTLAKWDVYNLIIKELIQLEGGRYFKEFQYRFTDGESPNKILLDIFDNIDPSEISGLCWSLKRRVEDFLIEDYVERFI